MLRYLCPTQLYKFNKVSFNRFLILKALVALVGIQLHALQATQRDPKEHIRPGANPFLARRPEDFFQTNVLPSVHDYASSVLSNAEP